MNSPLHWQSCGITHVGKVRKINEDALLELPEQGLWAVADGMGGHDAGDLASGAVVAALRRLRRPRWLGTAMHNQVAALRAANDLLVAEAERRGTSLIGSTLASLLSWQAYCVVSWVGDSRIYLFRGGRLAQISRDHSEVQELVDVGLIEAEEAEDHPLANVITRAIGSEEALDVAHNMLQVRPGDVFLLCSDGVTKELNDPDLETLCQRHQDPKALSEAIVDRCLAGECRDNVTIVTLAAQARPQEQD